MQTYTSSATSINRTKLPAVYKKATFTASLVMDYGSGKYMYTRFPVDVVCSNVLNVIDDDAEVQKIAHHLEEIALTSGGHGFVTVYEGDRSGTGRRTGSDSYQRNEPLRNYLRFFRHAVMRNGMIVIG